jgi:hypothetical protein
LLAEISYLVKTYGIAATDPPNNPAKLFGLRIFPKLANAETKSPPARNRNKSDVSVTDPQYWLAAPALISASRVAVYTRTTSEAYCRNAINTNKLPSERTAEFQSLKTPSFSR